MGSKPSTTLNISSTSTLAEIRSKYISLIALNPKNRAEVTRAYEAIISSPPDFDAYTPEVLATDLCKYADDVYSRVSTYTGTYIPVFSVDRAGVYRVCTGFRADPKRFSSPSEYASFCYKVVSFTKMVQKIDGERAKQETKDVFNEDRSLSCKEYNCEACSKGFRSKNQLINHLRSKKHLDRVGNNLEDSNVEIDSQIKNLKLEETEDPLQNIEESSDKIETPCTDITSTKNIHQEAKMFRTCGYCNSVFESRGKLLLHLRDSHQNEN